MKNQFFCLLLLVIATVFSCYSIPGTPQEDPKKPMIGLSIYEREGINGVIDVMTREAQVLGIDLRKAPPARDPGEQLNQIESLLTQGVKVLILQPSWGLEASAQLKKAQTLGVKIILFDSFSRVDPVDLLITMDIEMVGELQGAYLVSKAPKGNYILLSGDPADKTSEIFYRGAMKYIQPLVDRGDVKIVAQAGIENWSPQKAYDYLNDFLDANPNLEIHGILAANDGIAAGVIDSIRLHGLEGTVPITGQDCEPAAVKRIIEGTQGMSVLKDRRVYAEAAIHSALDLCKGIPPSEIQFLGTKARIPQDNTLIRDNALLIPPVKIDQDNWKKEVIDSGYFKGIDF